MASPSQPVAPRSHKKSRAGCNNCKRRKVKCDERHPLCRNCERHYVNLERCFPPEVPTAMGSHPPTTTLPSRQRRHVPAGTSSSSTGASTPQHSSNPPIRLPGSISNELIDPFEQYPPSKARKVDILLRHYLSSLVRHSFPFFHTGESVIQLWWPFLRADQVLFHVILHLSAHNLEVLQQESGTYQALEVRTEALDLLRNKIASASNIPDQLIVAVAILTAIEHERGSMKDLTSHLSGLRHMVRSRGGLDIISTESPLTANIAFWMAMVSVNEPDALPLVFDYPRVDHILPLLPLELTVFHNSGIADSLVSMVFEANDLSHRFSEISRSTSPESSLEILEQMSSMLQRLFQLQVLVDTPYGFHMSQSCRYAVALHVLFPLMAFFPDPALLISALVHKLKSSLYLLLPLVPAPNQIVLWFFAVGAVSAYQMPERRWFEGHLVALASDLHAQTWEEVKSLLSTVITHAIFCEDTFHTMWDETTASHHVELRQEVF